MNKKLLIGDYSKTESYKRSKRNFTYMMLGIAIFVALLLTMSGDQVALNAGYIH